MTTALSSWAIDPVRSRPDFSLEYMGFSTYRTSFRALEGSLGFDPAGPRLDPGGQHRRHQQSTRVEIGDAAHSKAAATLTIHGVSRPVVLDTHFLGQASIRSAGRSRIDRRDFGVSCNAVMDTGGAYLDERVQTSLAAAGPGLSGAAGREALQALRRGIRARAGSGRAGAPKRAQVAGIAGTTARSCTVPMTQTGAAAGTGHDIEIEHGRRGRALSHPVPCPPVRSILRLSRIAFRNDVRARLYVVQLHLQALHLLLQLLHLVSQRDEER